MVQVNDQVGDYTPLLLALVCIVAVGFAGATLTNANTSMVTDVVEGPNIEDVGDEQTSGEEAPTGGATGSGAGEDSTISFTRCIELLTNPLVVLGIVALYGLGLAVVARQFSAAASVLVGLTFIPPLSVAYFFLTNCRGNAIVGGSSGGGGANIARGVGSSSPVPPWMLVPLLLGVIFVGTAVLIWGTNDVEEFEPDTEEEEPEPTVEEMGEAAGAAADRIETAADVDNEVFRAWREMTGHLEIPNPESSTTGEFAHAAIDVGMGRDDVMALKNLFDEVRYGTTDPSVDHEERAVEVLRRIEDTYADVEVGDGRTDNGADPSDGRTEADESADSGVDNGGDA